MENPTTPEIANVLQARRFEMIGADGEVRIVLGELPNPDEDAPPIHGVAVLDREGRPRTWLALLPTGPSLTFDHGGNIGLEIGVDDGSGENEPPGAYLVMADRKGTPGLMWRVNDEGAVAMKVAGVTQ